LVRACACVLSVAHVFWCACVRVLSAALRAVQTAVQDRIKTPARQLWEPQERCVPGALGMINGRVGVVTKGKRFDTAGKPTQVRLRWPDGSHSRWHLIQVRKRRSFGPFDAKMPSFCQDRLGTNMGKAEKKGGAFSSST
jgi:hypothetical protein